MKKLIFILLAVVFCAACEKEEDKFTMSADDLIGIYWTRARCIFSGVGSDGEKYTHDTDEGLLTGWGSEFWYFIDNNRVIVYYSTPYPPYLYEETTYQYDPVQKKLTIGKSQYDLLQFTPKQFVYTYVEEDVERIYYFRPFAPSEGWFESFKDATRIEYK